VKILEVRDLDKSFGGLHAVNSVSFSQDEGSIKAVIGPNGAGKTTIFNLIAGSLEASSGEVLFAGEDISSLKPHMIARKGISRTFQGIKLSRHMTVLENVMIGVHVRSRAGFLSGMLNLPGTWKEEKFIRDEALASIEELGIADHRDKKTGSLSFGTQRSVELARAMASKPRLLLLDEPASGLNVRETKELAGRITRIREKGISILLVEHDMSLVMDICDDIVVLNFGSKIAEGKPREIQANREVVDIYLGEEDA
jgi:branched-chain amino acid transport system ATP-binding protein